MSVLKRKSSIALITGIIVVLVLMPLWYMMLAPSLVVSELEKIDLTTSFEGNLYYFGYGPGSPKFHITIDAHVYAEEVKGDNVILRLDAAMMNITDPDRPNKLEDFSYNLTYVFNKFTLENVGDAPEADNNRTGYDPLFPSHLKAGEDINKVWIENLNTTATLEFEESVKQEGVTLYKYSLEKTITKEMTVLPFGLRNFTLTSAKTILIEPLSGMQAYTEDETLIVYVHYEQQEPAKLVDLKYESTAEAKDDGIAEAKTLYDSMQLLDLYIPTIFGAVAIILLVGLAFNTRRLRKKPHSPKT